MMCTFMYSVGFHGGAYAVHWALVPYRLLAYTVVFESPIYVTHCNTLWYAE